MALLARQGVAAPIPRQVSYQGAGSDVHPMLEGIHHQFKVHDFLSKRALSDSGASFDGTEPSYMTAPNSPIVTSVPGTPDVSGTHSGLFDPTAPGEVQDKPALLKSVALGIKKFFSAIKTWLRSGSKAETFKNFGRKFTSWLRDMKARIRQSKDDLIDESGAEIDGSASVAESQLQVVPYKPKSKEEIEALTNENIRITMERAEAERRIQELESEYSGLFDSDEAQAGNGNAYDALLNAHRTGDEEDNAPPRGDIGSFSADAKRRLYNLWTHEQAGWLHDEVPATWDDGARSDPSYISPTDALFIEQGLDPTKLSTQDRRNYQVILEWYKDQNAVQDVTHPKHHELYDTTRHPYPETNLWGTDVYYEQVSNPAPIPSLREKMNDPALPFSKKLSAYGQFGLIGNDPNRPKFWYHDWIPTMSRDNELEDWIDSNIPISWINKHFPLPDGPRTTQYFNNALPTATKQEMANTLNQQHKDAAVRGNNRLVELLHDDGMQEATWDAIRNGKSAAKASLDFPKLEDMKAKLGPEDLNKMRQQVYSKDLLYKKLVQAKKAHDADTEKLHGRLREEGVVVI